MKILSLKSLGISVLATFLVGIVLTQCTNKDESKLNPLYPVGENSTLLGINATIPGDNFTNSTLGGITLYSLSLPSSNFTSEKVRCEINKNNKYVMTMVSPSSKLSYTTLTFSSKPVISKSYTLVASDLFLDSTKAYVEITILKENKSWRSKKGNLNLNISGTSISAELDTAFVECTSNITDTTYYYMLGTLFCQ